jgi:hypothetical protein
VNVEKFEYLSRVNSLLQGFSNLALLSIAGLAGLSDRPRSPNGAAGSRGLIVEILLVDGDMLLCVTRAAEAWALRNQGTTLRELSEGRTDPSWSVQAAALWSTRQ